MVWVRVKGVVRVEIPGRVAIRVRAFSVRDEGYCCVVLAKEGDSVVFVIAKAGIHFLNVCFKDWVPAFAGTTRSVFSGTTRDWESFWVFWFWNRRARVATVAKGISRATATWPMSSPIGTGLSSILPK